MQTKNYQKLLIIQIVSAINLHALPFVLTTFASFEFYKEFAITMSKQVVSKASKKRFSAFSALLLKHLEDNQIEAAQFLSKKVHKEAYTEREIKKK